MVQQVPVGGSGKTRVLRDYGAGAVTDNEEIVGEVPDLLAALLREQRLTNRLLMVLIDEDVDIDNDDSSDDGE